jgi:hypothetical protein
VAIARFETHDLTELGAQATCFAIGKPTAALARIDALFKPALLRVDIEVAVIAVIAIIAAAIVIAILSECGGRNGKHAYRGGGCEKLFHGPSSISFFWAIPAVRHENQPGVFGIVPVEHEPSCRAGPTFAELPKCVRSFIRDTH